MFRSNILNTELQPAAQENEIVNSLDAAAERGLLRNIGVDIELLSTTETHNVKSNGLLD